MDCCTCRPDRSSARWRRRRCKCLPGRRSARSRPEGGTYRAGRQSSAAAEVASVTGVEAPGAASVGALAPAALCLLGRIGRRRARARQTVSAGRVDNLRRGGGRPGRRNRSARRRQRRGARARCAVRAGGTEDFRRGGGCARRPEKCTRPPQPALARWPPRRYTRQPRLSSARSRRPLCTCRQDRQSPLRRRSPR